MAHGLMLGESLRPGAVLGGFELVITEIRRVEPQVLAPGQPPCWTLFDVEIADDELADFAIALSGAMEQGAWYADFHSKEETFVVFADRVFCYPRGDAAGRADAQAYGRKIGVPEAQLDWDG